MRLPTNGKWQVKHGKDFFADLVRTRNLNFDTEGYISLGRKALSLYNVNDDAGFNKVTAIVPDDSNSVVYILTAGTDYYLTPGTGVVTKLTNSHAGTTAGDDGCFFAGILHATSTTKVQSYSGGSGGTWTDRITGLSASYPHPIAVFEDSVQLSVGNGNTVQNYNTGYTNNGSSSPYTLTLPAQYVVISLRWRGGRMYIGTRHIYGGEAKLFVWDGTATSTGPGYGVGASAIFSMEEFQGSMALITSAGQLLRFNGGGFDELAHFPVYDTPYPWGPIKTIATATADRVPNRGMCRVGNRLYINITGDINSDAENYLVTMPSGVWVYEPAVGLYHRAGHQYYKHSTLTITALNSNILTVGTHSLLTGDPVFASSVGNITGLTTNNTYYAISVASTTIKLARSRADAINGTSLTLSGTPSGDTLQADNHTPTGQVFDTVAGAIAAFSAAMKPFFGTGVVFGCEPTDNTETTKRSFNSLGAQSNRGSFVTSPIPAAGVQDTFQKIILQIEGMTTSADSVVIKYRMTKRLGMPTSVRPGLISYATWTSTTTFTVNSLTKAVSAVQIGDEVTFLSGSAAGLSTKITNIDTSTSTYVYTTEDTMPVAANDSSEVIFEDWTVLGTYTKNTMTVSDGYLEVPIGRRGAAIQFKVELRGYDTKVRLIDVVTKVDKPSV